MERGEPELQLHLALKAGPELHSEATALDHFLLVLNTYFEGPRGTSVAPPFSLSLSLSLSPFLSLQLFKSSLQVVSGDKEREATQDRDDQ